MKLSDHFTLEELTASDYATRHGLDNTPTGAALGNLKRLADSLEQVRAVLGAPIRVNSGYRSPKVNAGIGSGPTSAHVDGRAADFICPDFGTPKDICRELILAGLRWDQLIYEGGWVHLAIPKAGEGGRREILTAHFAAGRVSYTHGLTG